MDRYDAEDLRRYRDRRRMQKEYQADYRRKMRRERKPNRIEIATALLEIQLEKWGRSADALDLAARALADQLANKGIGKRRRKFDYEEAFATVKAMTAREIKTLRRRERSE